MNTAEFCIIAVGYNRPDSMKRLLNSLCLAEYDGHTVDLLISIDKGERQQEIIQIANNFEWKFGKKSIRAYDERQGLKKHIIQCGDVSTDYTAIIVLEDDITVSKAFFSYSRQCVEKYKDDTRVAGISLYTHHINVGVGNFFEAEFNGYDCFFMQFAQSWGQCWTRKMWASFKCWYIENKDKCFNEKNKHFIESFPEYIVNWGEHSWMKYYMAYIVQNNLFFVYPYFSLSTNHSEAGQHRKTTSSDYQVAMNNAIMEYRLPEYESAVKYDVFFERLDLSINGYLGKKVILDLYGTKRNFGLADVLITTNPHPYRLIESIKLKFRPHELNCIYREQGKDIFIYDLRESCKSREKTDKNLRTRYDVKAISWRKLFALSVSEAKEAIIKKLY